MTTAQQFFDKYKDQLKSPTVDLSEVLTDLYLRLSREAFGSSVMSATLDDSKGSDQEVALVFAQQNETWNEFANIFHKETGADLIERDYFLRLWCKQLPAYADVLKAKVLELQMKKALEAHG